MTRGVFVSRAESGDAPAVAALAAECFARPWAEGQFADEIALGPPGAVLIARQRVSGERLAPPVAFCAYRVVVDELHVLDVAVAPAARRLGIARRLLELALRRGARSGARVAWLEVREGNAAALALYAALGFREAGRRRGYYRAPDEDALLLSRAGLQELC